MGKKERTCEYLKTSSHFFYVFFLNETVEWKALSLQNSNFNKDNIWRFLLNNIRNIGAQLDEALLLLKLIQARALSLKAKIEYFRFLPIFNDAVPRSKLQEERFQLQLSLEISLVLTPNSLQLPATN
ncbi:hypothetical protein M9H77_26800 [Catharanthus roseus]|uniref:Uncharacterized protein n=1 Tax=Catharanthus roseus TaxID=4058 RepID=A0ACC0ADE6_CATRO|nr:hypothetical protein M9H77_26800 [Catharanthus roseus]